MYCWVAWAEGPAHPGAWCPGSGVAAAFKKFSFAPVPPAPITSPQPCLSSSFLFQVLGAALQGSSRAAPPARGGRVPHTWGGCSRAARGNSSRGQGSGEGTDRGPLSPGGREAHGLAVQLKELHSRGAEGTTECVGPPLY